LYPYALPIDGNDKRLIDVAVPPKHPIVSARSHQELCQGRSYIFSRDCLELQIDVDGSPLYLFVNHLKSMLGIRVLVVGDVRLNRESRGFVDLKGNLL
jgi:hypothetical protein